MVVGPRCVTELEDALRPLCATLGVTLIERGRDVQAELPLFLKPLARPFSGYPDSDSIKLIYSLTETSSRTIRWPSTSIGRRSA